MRYRSRELVQLVFRGSRGSAEAALLLLGTLCKFSGARLQFERPRGRLRARTDLDLFAGGLEPKHLDFHGVSSGRETGEFISAGFVSSGDRAALALRGDYSCSGQRLASKADRSRVSEAALSEQRHAQNHAERKSDH